jgi:glycosyltransferase involved in cell wall biosynthesis
MKIVRVIARLNVGGPAKHVVWLTSGLQSADWESLLVAGTVPPGEDDMGYFASDHGVTPVFVPEMSREISLKDAVTVWKLYQLFRREQPDLIHTHTAKAGTVGRVAGLLYVCLSSKRKRFFVHTYHGHIFHSYYGGLKTRLFLTIEKILAWLITDRIIVLSEQQRHEINEQFGVGRASQFSVIPLGLDLTEFSDWQNRGKSVREELGAAQNELLVGIVGRLTNIKNHELFLRAAATFKKECADSRVRFVIVGDGALRDALEQQAAGLGIADDVEFVGSRKDMAEIYPALDIVALTSHNEGTPLTLIEAMANARPVIATAVGGVVDLLGPPVTSHNDFPFEICERGIKVNPGNERYFAAGLSYLASHAQARREIGERGLQFVTSYYSKERLLHDVKLLYQDLVKREGQSRDEL